MKKTEYWDVYDQQRRATGRVIERVNSWAEKCVALSQHERHLAVEIWVTDGSGCLLMTKRAPCKPYGNLWEVTGGAVQAGENSLQGATRELLEETGIDACGELEFLCTVNLARMFLDEYMLVRAVSTEHIVLQDGETIDAKWVDKVEFQHMREENQICAPTLSRFAAIADKIY